MGDHNPYRSRYYTTHSEDTIHGSRVWSDGVLIAGACTQADAETICALLNRWSDINYLIGNLRTVQKALGSMTDSFDLIRENVDAAINHIDDPTWEDHDDDDDGGAWQEARMMAGMAHGNRGLADHGGLEEE